MSARFFDREFFRPRDVAFVRFPKARFSDRKIFSPRNFPTSRKSDRKKIKFKFFGLEKIHTRENKGRDFHADYVFWAPKKVGSNFLDPVKR